MEYSINIVDILNIAKRNIKIVLVCALIFAVLAGAYGVLSTSPQELTAEQKDSLAKQSENYQKYTEKSEAVKEQLQQKLVKAYGVIENHPIMQKDPENIKFRLLTFTLADDFEVNRNLTFAAWIDSLSCKQLFGVNKDVLKKYKREFVYVAGGLGEVTVTVLESDEYDYNKVAGRLLKYINNKAKKNGIKILESQNNVIKGFSQGIIDRQDIINNNAAKITNELNILQNYKMEEPQSYSESTGKRGLKIMIFLIAGLIFGAVIGMGIVSFNDIRKGRVLSADHVEDFYGIEKLAAGKLEDSNYPKVIAAVVDAVGENGGNVMVISNEDNADYERLTKLLEEESGREYYYSKAKDDDVVTIEKLSQSAGIMIPVTIGKTSFRDIKEVVKLSQKYKKALFGYAIIE